MGTSTLILSLKLLCLSLALLAICLRKSTREREQKSVKTAGQLLHLINERAVPLSELRTSKQRVYGNRRAYDHHEKDAVLYRISRHGVRR